MQSKIIAAAVAGTAAAIKLEAPTTMLAQAAPLDPRAGVETDCHGTYMYQCMQVKVDAALGYLTTDTQDRSDLSQLKARTTKEEMVRGIEDLRSDLQMGLSATRKAGETAVRDQLRSGMGRIEDRLAAHVASLRDQVTRDSPIAVARKLAEGDIKDIYYEDQQLEKLQGREDKKARIAAVLQAFADASFPVFGEPELTDLTALVEAETQAICDAVDAANAAYDAAAAQAAATMDAAIQANSDAMDALNAEQIAAMDARIAMLVEEYLKIFWETVADIYSSVSYNERQGLIWKALYQKDAFVAGLNAIREDLVRQLGANKADLVAQMNAERVGLAATTAAQRVAMRAQVASDKADLIAAGSQALSDLQDEIDRLSPQSPSHEQEIANLTDFIYDLAVIRFNPNDSGNGHADGVQPYGEWVARRIADNIANAFHDTLDTFQAEGQGAVDGAVATTRGEEAALAADRQAASDLLNAQTAGLIAETVGVREALEADLAADYERITSAAEASREADQIAFTTTKNDLWKDLSWIVRQTLASGRHNHGYRAGPVFGFRSELAQVSADGDSRSPNPFLLTEKPELQGWGAEGPEDGYDPYGYGDQGFGFGPSQTQYKEVQEKLAAYEAAVADTTAKHEARMAASRAAMEAEWGQAQADFDVQLASKWDRMSTNVTTQNTDYAAVVVARTATVMQALADARTAIHEANVRKVAALDAEEKEIRWAITSIWNYDRQHALNEALTAARAAADERCAAINADLEAQLVALQAEYEAFVVGRQAELDANTTAALQACDDAKVEQQAILSAFIADQQAAYAAWEAKENAEFAAFMAASRRAWMAIQVSYCLKHGQAGDVTQIGHGCSWGTGAGAGNAGYKKGVEIEAHMESLTYGQDPIDIKHVYDEAWLIQGAVDWTMQGVPEEYARLIQVLCDTQDAIQARVDGIRVSLEERLTTHEAAANQRMVDLAAAEAAALLAREDAVVAGVQSFRAGLEAEVDADRVEKQWAIKELVWQLGYSQGYKFGGHDGEDARLMAQITDLREQYEALIQAQEAKFAARVASELAAAEVAYAASQSRADALQAAEGVALEAAIAQATTEMEAAIAAGDADFDAASASARAGLEAFINARLAAWQELYDQEAINAKWQEDSYYRLSLLRLLAEKQAAIDAEVARTYAAFDAERAAKKAGQNAFNAVQRGEFADHVSETRATFTGDVAANDAEMERIITERRASLVARLQAEADAFAAEMAEDRAEMKRLLKEIYNYNTHDLDATASATGDAAPWSVEQHNGFLSKLHYWSKAQLSGKDAMLADMRQLYATTTAGMLDDVAAEKLASDRAITDLREASTKALGRMSQDEIIAFDALMDAELGLLQDARAQMEAQVATDVEAIRKNVIYAMHVLRYAGGYDVQQTGFGKGASSFHTTGNYLTGVSELDDFRLPNLAGYAQVQDKENGDDTHDDTLEALLLDSCTQFDAVIADARAAMAARVGQDKADAAAAAAAAIERVRSTGADMSAALAALIAGEEGAMAAGNDARKATLQGIVDGQVEICTSINDVNIGKVDAWIGDRLEWADRMMDSYLKKHLIKELQATQARLVGELQARTDQAVADGAAAVQGLCDAMDAAEAAQQADDAAQQAAFDSFAAQTVAATAAAVGASLAEFGAAADAEEAGFNATMDQTVQNWAYYLKYLFGYQGYETSIYQDFDFGADYTDIMGYPSGDGAYSDLGTQGPDLGNSGEVNLPAGGYGVGGQGGSDYLYSGDHTALAYGKDIGPDPQFFSGSILDPSPVMADDGLVHAIFNAKRGGH